MKSIIIEQDADFAKILKSQLSQLNPEYNKIINIVSNINIEGKLVTLIIYKV